MEIPQHHRVRLPFAAAAHATRLISASSIRFIEESENFYLAALEELPESELNSKTAIEIRHGLLNIYQFIGQWDEMQPYLGRRLLLLCCCPLPYRLVWFLLTPCAVPQSSCSRTTDSDCVITMSI